MIKEFFLKLKAFLKEKKDLLAVFGGGLAGFVNGLFGGGGGMIIVPVLLFVLGYTVKRAHATAILIILPLSLLSGLFYVAFGTLRWEIGLPVSVGVTIGGIIGAFLLSKLSSKWIVLIFGLLMIFAGGKMLFF